MNRFAIGAEYAFDDLAVYLNRAVQDLRAKQIEIVTGRTWLGNVVYFTLEWKQTEGTEEIRNYLAHELADFITLFWERKDIERQIIKEYTYYDADEVEYLAEQAHKALISFRKTRFSKLRRIEIELMIRKYLKESTVMQLEGFIRFRMKEFDLDRNLMIETAIDEYLMDREYQEFVTLLRSFLSVQTPRSPMVHLIIEEGWNRLIDHDGLPITDEDLNRFSDDLIDNDIHSDDMVVSTLITLAPQKLQIHIPHELAEQSILLDTANRVFEDRVEICKGCALCQEPLEFWDQNGHLPLDYSK